MPDIAPSQAGAGPLTTERRQLSESIEIIPHREAAAAFITRICFKIGPPELVGLELEWHIHDRRTPTAPLSSNRIAAALGPWCPPALRASPSPAATMPNGSAVTVEPGGQLEISTSPASSLAECVGTAAADARLLHARLAHAGLAALGAGSDPYRHPSRLLDLPRYAAMEAVLRSAQPVRANHDGLDRRGAALPGRRTRGRSRLVRQPLADPARRRPAARRDVRELPDARRPADRLAVHPAGGRGSTSTRPARRHRRLGGDPARGVRALRARRSAAVCPPRRRAVERAAAASRSPTGSPVRLAHRRPTAISPTTCRRCSRRCVRPGTSRCATWTRSRGDGWIVPTAVVWALTATHRAREAADAAGRAGGRPLGRRRTGRPGRSRDGAGREGADRDRDGRRLRGSAGPHLVAGRRIRRADTRCAGAVPLTIGRQGHDRHPHTRQDRGPACLYRRRADQNAPAQQGAHRRRRHRRPDPPALAADVAARLGLRAHRQPGGTLAGA